MGRKTVLFFDLGVVTYTEIDAETGEHRAQIKTLGDGATGGVSYTHFPYGDWGRHPDPELDPDNAIAPAKTAQALYAWYGDELHIWPLEDTRVIGKLPALKKGETMKYGPAGNFIRFELDGSISLMTDDPTIEGSTVYLSIRPTELAFHSPWGHLVFDATGFSLRCKSGARFDLGQIYGLPKPLDALSTYAAISAHMVSLEGSSVSLGPSALPSDNAMKTTPTVATLTAQLTLLQSVAKAIATFVPTTGFTATAIAEVAEAAVAAAALPATPATHGSTTAVA